MTAQPAPEYTLPQADPILAPDQELERLRSDLNRIRAERDMYRADLAKRDATASTELTLLSANLSDEIKKEFYGSVTTLLWVIGLLVLIATAGGYWTLSDQINRKVEQNVREAVKEQRDELSDIRKQILDALTAFRFQTLKATEELTSLKQKASDEEHLSSIIFK